MPAKSLMSQVVQSSTSKGSKFRGLALIKITLFCKNLGLWLTLSAKLYSTLISRSP